MSNQDDKKNEADLRADLSQQSLELRTFKAMADFTSDGVIVFGLDRTIRYANAAFRAMTGYGDRLLGKHVYDLVPEEESARSTRDVRPVLQGGGQWKGTVTFRRPDGSTWLSQGTIVTLHNDAGAPYAYTGIYRDITEQVRQEEALRESEARQRALLNALPDMMFVLDADGAYVDWKAHRQEQLLVDPARFLGRRMAEMLPPELAEQFQASIREALRTREVQVLEYPLTLGGETREHEARFAACDERQVMVLVRDVTDTKRAEAERLALQAQVIAAQEAALRELATPVIPIADGVIAMPLIGAIDPVRAEQILEALLAGIAAERVKTAIIDVTGVKAVDADVASALVRSAQAARLLGAQVVLTGIGPKVAQMLVALGADLAGIVTYGTLKTGIARALR